MFRLLSSRKTVTAAVAAAAAASASYYSFSASCDSTTPALSPAEFRKFKLHSVKSLTPDTSLFTFSLPEAHQELGLTVSSCLVVKADVNG